MRSFVLMALLASPLLAWADNEPPEITPHPVSAPERGRPLVFEADIRDPSGVFEPLVYWRVTGTRTYANVRLHPVQGSRYRAELVVEPGVTSVDYVLEAFDNNGNGPARVGSQAAPLVVSLVKKPVPADPLLAVSAPSKAPAFVALGLGGAGVVAGTIFGLLAKGSHDSFLQTYKPTERVSFADQTRSNALIADVSFGVGLVGLGVGTVLLLTADAPASAGFTATVAPSFDGLAFSGAF